MTKTRPSSALRRGVCSNAQAMLSTKPSDKHMTYHMSNHTHDVTPSANIMVSLLLYRSCFLQS